MIRVGRCKYVKGKQILPFFPDYTKVVVLMKSSPYWELSPYYLKDENGVIHENKHQFSKVYRQVPASKRTYSRFDKTVIWEHPAETHIDEDGNITEEYKKWREKGMKNKWAVRYPVGFNHRHKCEYALLDDLTTKLDYVQARKQIYLPVYLELVKKQPKFVKLKNKLLKGEKLLIIEVDGPHQESLDYYKEKYGVEDDFIENDTIQATKRNMEIMLNDTKHPFGHGYCLAIALATELAGIGIDTPVHPVRAVVI